MRFSSRIAWGAEVNPMTKLLRRKRAEGAKILDLTITNPTRADFNYPAAQILDSLHDPRSLSYDPHPAGLLSAREAIAEYYAEKDLDVSPERLILTASTSEAYSYLFKLLTEPDDAVLVPTPSYPLFEHLAGMERVRIEPYPLVYEGTWRINWEGLEAAVMSRVRALILVNPNNPTGSFLKRDELPKLIAFCRARELALIVDEVFADYSLRDDTRRAGSISDVDEILTFCLSGLSKVAGLPQMKLGWIAVNGPRGLREQALEGLEWIADTYLSVAAPVQCGAKALLAAGAVVRTEIQRRTRANLTFLQAAIASSALRVLDVEGGWSAILEVPRVRTEEEWTLKLLETSNTLLQPGFFYDFDHEAFLVVSLLTAPQILEEGVKRILAESNSRVLRST